MEETAQLSYLAVLHLVVQMHFVWKVVTFLCVSVTLVSKATDTAVQTLMNAQVLRLTSVPLTPCVPTLTVLISVAALGALQEMGKTVPLLKSWSVTLLAVGTECAGIIAALLNVSAQMVLLVKTIVQILMSVKTKMSVIPTPCVPTLRVPTSVAAFEVTRVMAELAQLWKLTVLPLAVKTRFVRKMLVFPYVSVTLVIKATDTIVQMQTNVLVLKEMTATRVLCVPTVRVLMFVVV